MVPGLETALGSLLSAFLQILFDRVLPRTNLFDFLRRHDLDEIFFENLKTRLLQVNAVLSDAEEKQVTNLFVRQWIDELKDAAYHTTDLLDEIHSLALAESLASNSSDESDLKKVIQKSKSELEKMTEKLENIAKYKDVLGLKESFSGKPSPRLQLTSLVDETEVYGRGTDKKEIMKFLTSTGKNGQIPAVVAIVGIAGVGKTTLAQLLYNDAEVKRRFKTRAWIYFSEDFDVFKVTKTIYESVTSQACNIQDLNILQVKLKETLTSEKFLIVLDDVWNEYYNKWDALRNFLKVGASKSRIIVTTRSQGVASTMHASFTYHLQPLEDNACWSVFANHAFGSPDAHDASPKLKSIGEEIMKKCGGLPLAAKVLGSLLYSKVDVHEWKNILNSNIWDLPSDKSDILPSLKLSYFYLSSHLKQGFAYCSIFPKGYAFDKEKLILLWMAEGFLTQPRSGKTMEEVGIECFNELLSRSFFQQASDDNKSCFIMHDVVNDLAQFASGESCFKFERGKSHCISKKVRHFSFVRDEFSESADKFDTLNDSKFLSTFLPLSLSSSTGSCSISPIVVEGYLPRQKRLRVLSLSYYVNWLKDDQFKNLIHLRYLDLSHYPIDKVPESIDCLYNLQTLILSHCIQLVRLPSNMQNLIHLRHLDLTETNRLRMMPPEFGMLKSLRTLTKFVVNQEGSSVKELGGLSHLGGKLSILELQNVGDAEDAEGADLKKKENIKELEFSWSSTDRADGETAILEKLHPHENIEKLSIRGYGGTGLPNWLGDSKFSNMVVLYLIDCRNCSSWPSLGQLSSLQELHVKNMQEIESIDIEFYGQAANPFASLRILKFEHMPKWKNWSTSAVTGVVFPLLQELHIQKCENLIGIPNCLPSLEDLFIQECGELQSLGIIDYPQLQHLSIKSCYCLEKFTLNFSSNHKSLKLTSFSVSNCNNLRSMPEQMCTLLTSLQTLNISGCSELVVFPDGGLPPSLKKLTIQNCVKLQSMPEQTHKLLSSLRTLKISGCPELKSFPDGGFSPRLKTLTIQNCKNLIGLPNCLPLLKSLFIHDCGQLQFDDIMDYTQLQHLSIKSCYHLKKFTLNFSSKIKSLKIHDCGYLRFIEISSNLHQDLNFFQKLEIIECPILEIFPGRGLPAPNLTSFSVSSCNNLRSMPKQMCTLLTSLQTLNISDCPRLVSFPIGGLPPSLQILTIQNCVNLTPQNAWGLSNMTSLTRLTIECVYANVTSFPDEVLLPASLTSLEISGFPVLKTLNLSGLQHLTLLKDLEIHSCNQLQILSDGSLPSSLSSLSITGCSSLTDQCQRDRGIYWDKISHIPTLSINGNEIR